MPQDRTTSFVTVIKTQIKKKYKCRVKNKYILWYCNTWAQHPHNVFSSGIIVGAVVRKTGGSLRVFLSVATTNHTGQKRSLIYLVSNRDVRADRKCSKLQAWLDIQSIFNFTGDFVPSAGQNGTVKERLKGNQSKSRWCHFPVSITLCYRRYVYGLLSPLPN